MPVTRPPTLTPASCARAPPSSPSKASHQVRPKFANTASRELQLKSSNWLPPSPASWIVKMVDIQRMRTTKQIHTRCVEGFENFLEMLVKFEAVHLALHDEVRWNLKVTTGRHSQQLLRRASVAPPLPPPPPHPLQATAMAGCWPRGTL